MDLILLPVGAVLIMMGFSIFVAVMTIPKHSRNAGLVRMVKLMLFVGVVVWGTGAIMRQGNEAKSTPKANAVNFSPSS